MQNEVDFLLLWWQQAETHNAFIGFPHDACDLLQDKKWWWISATTSKKEAWDPYFVAHLTLQAVELAPS